MTEAHFVIELGQIAAAGPAWVPYPIFLTFSQKSPKPLKNSQKPHFNPLRIENSGSFNHLHRFLRLILAQNLQN